MDAIEAKRRRTNLDLLEAFFKASPMIWIEAKLLEGPGGRQAWRSRVAELRTKRSMTIENKITRYYRPRTRELLMVVSEYRYLPYTPLGSDAADLRERSLFDGDPAGERR